MGTIVKIPSTEWIWRARNVIREGLANTQEKIDIMPRHLPGGFSIRIHIKYSRISLSLYPSLSRGKTLCSTCQSALHGIRKQF